MKLLPLLILLLLSGCQGSILTSGGTLMTATFLQRREIGGFKASRDAEGGVSVELQQTNTAPSVEAVKALADIARGVP